MLFQIKDWYKFEYQVIIHLSLLSIFLLFSSLNLITFYLSLEFYSFSSIFLVFLSWRNSDNKLTILGLIYYLINVLGSITILFSFLYLFSINSILSFKDLYFIDNIGGNSFFWKILFLSGFLMKLGCVPFHFWVLPLYNSIHTYITFFQSILPKFIYIILIYNIYGVYIKEYVFIFSIMTLLIGSLIGLKENYIKKLMGASSIFNVGLFLIIINSKDIIFNISIYFINVIPIFFLFFLFFNKNKYFDFQDSWKLQDLKNISSNYPIFSIIFLLLIFSLIGIPPLGGFFYKLNVFIYGLKKAEFIWLIIAIVATLISTIYYLYFIQYLYPKIDKISILSSQNKWGLTLIFTVFSIINICFYIYLPYIYYIFSLMTI